MSPYFKDFIKDKKLRNDRMLSAFFVRLKIICDSPIQTGGFKRVLQTYLPRVMAAKAVVFELSIKKICKFCFRGTRG